MAAEIQRLSQEAINQIAAGEVIENPASVVKELVENSLDAGASEISVAILAGGQKRVRVTDNGSGMSPEDAHLAALPHTTSKITGPEDLGKVCTLGFRAEALASIASVSKLTLETSKGGEGVRLTIEGGKPIRSEPIAREQGTQITVDDLFFNAPVRRRFQRASRADTAQIRKTLTLAALAYPEVSFTLRQGEEVLLTTGGLPGLPFLEAFQETAEEVLGNEFCRNGFPFERQEGEIRMRGLLGTPSFDRPTRSGQMLLINRRPVDSALIASAVAEAFSTRLSNGRHPTFALHLDLPSDLLDVNVHPQKREIRLRQEPEVKQKIVAAISKALVGEMPHNEWQPPLKVPVFEEEIVSFEPLSRPPQTVIAHQVTPDLIEKPIRVFGLVGGYLLTEPAGPFEDQDGVLLIHIKRGQTRIAFERLIDSMKKGAVTTQALAVPIPLELLPEEFERVMRCQAALHRLGIELRPFGETTLLIESLPPLLAGVDPQQIIEELLPTLNLKEAGEGAAAQAAIRMAPHSPLTIDQAGAFVREWMRCREPMQCPRGKRIASLLPLQEIAQRF